VNPHVRFDRRPELQRPTLICAFQGWNDGGEAATVAAHYLIERLGAQTVGRLDPEDFYDFQVNRPTVRLVEGVSRVIEWPLGEFAAASIDDRGLVVFVAPEPNVRWRGFTEALVDAGRELGVELLVTLGGFLTDVPHSHDVPVVGSARDAAEAERLGLASSRYEGPTGITGVLHDAANRAGLASISLWAAVPHYLPVAANPKAALALVRRTSELLEVPVETSALDRAVERWERGVARLLEDNDELADYVRRLEAAADAVGERDDDQGRGDQGMQGTMEIQEPIPSGDSIAAELERFLRDQSGGEGSPA
jgi:predicted ATP-grasp superfamily ATP-dependent carboligase